ncbi:hypothetical protein LOTGIDRAFT_169491 [Lottia gigantea]|uniref:Methyltransferase FkbM domain-containing protein n=1 Tax=Lottia gigantea TaxID=225164 RepID=V4B4C0_LOTGI|nr:hypothetical protein LOTGIDRAFT_169491 [Lottia gigantea]ESO83274.1 hypothetical protein LOTGIDRAFT_169491 [Lottia gigantea]
MVFFRLKTIVVIFTVIIVLSLFFTFENSTKSKYEEKDLKQTRTDAKILRWINKQWIELNHFCEGRNNFLRAVLNSPAGKTPIFVHDLNDDAAVSKQLYDKGIWDPENVGLVHKYLTSYPDLVFMDLGAHVGTFSLMAAKLGRQVWSVDPLRGNLFRLCKSIEIGNFTEQVTVFYTALSDTYSVFNFQTDYKNIGGTRLNQKIDVTNFSQNGDATGISVISTVKLDDLLPLVNFKRAFIKMDVEEHEMNVLVGGQRFLDSVDVPYILMEWFWHKKPSGKFGPSIIDYMTKRNYKPFHPATDALLSLNDYHNWPIDVLWKKYS